MYRKKTPKKCGESKIKLIKFLIRFLISLSNLVIIFLHKLGRKFN